MKLGFVAVLCLLGCSLGCAPGLDLEWKHDRCAAVEYQLDSGPISDGDERSKEIIRRLVDEAAQGDLDAAARGTESFRLEDPTSLRRARFSVKPNADDFEVLATSFSTSPQSDSARPANTEGLRVLAVGLDRRGRIRSFYLPQSQKNIAALLFTLPDFDHVRTGDSWPIPVQLIELGNGYRSEQPRQWARATLVGIESGDDRKSYARILFVADELVEGVFQLEKAMQAMPFRLRASYIGVGTMDVAGGCWTRYSGYMVYEGTGAALTHAGTAYILRPSEDR